MGTVISNLKARFGVDTSDFKKGLKDGERATEDFKGAAGGILEDFASMFGVNMGAVNSALGTANKSLVFLGQSFGGAAKGGNILAISMKVLKFALISTGIGAIVVGLGSLIAYFTKSGEGADKFAKILSQVKSVVNNVIDRFAVFGKGLYELMTGKFKKGWETMAGAFKDMGTEIKEDWKAAGDLADRLDALEDKEIALIKSLAERRAKVDELKRLTREETEDYRKRLNLIGQTEELIKSVYGDEIKLEKERLSIMKEQLAIQTSDPTDEQRKELAELEAKINELLGKQSSELTTLLKLKNSTLEVEKKALRQFKDYSNLKLPAMLDPKVYATIQRSLTDLQHTFIKTKESTSALFDVMGTVAVDATTALNSAFEGAAAGLGEFFGALASGSAGVGDVGKLIGTTFADLAITVGKIAIGAGMAVLGIKESLISLHPWGAIAAGIALVALGSAIKGSLKNAASGSGGGGGASLSSNSSTYDTRGAATYEGKPIVIQINGKLTADGPGLKYVFDQEIRRRSAST